MSAAGSTPVTALPVVTATNSAVVIVQQVFFAIILQPLFYVWWKHGRYGFLGWYFLTVFCIARIVGDALLQSAKSAHSFSEPGAIISNVALSPLYFSILGLAHEASISVRSKNSFMLGWQYQIMAHSIICVGLILSILGGLKFYNPKSTQSQLATALDFMHAAVAIYALSWAIVAILVGISFKARSHVPSERLLLKCAIACLPFLLVRMLYSLLGVAINNSSWNPVHGGSLAEYVAMSVLPEFIITTILAYGGLKSRNVIKEREAIVSGSDRHRHRHHDDNEEMNFNHAAGPAAK